MLNELKILFNNIKNFRQIITESVGENDIVKYIQNHEYIYIYYGGDGKNKRGYRTIRPYVLGISTAGNQVIRAWQDRGKSTSYSNRDRGDKHDYWSDTNGEIKPGWRMFRLDKIEKVYPTGKKFNNSDGSVMIPPNYKEGSDADMSSIIAYVSTNSEPEVAKSEPTTQPISGKVNKWDNFNQANKNDRKITIDDINKLRNIATNIYKKNKNNFIVVINNNKEFELINVKDKMRVPKDAIVGSLSNLYDTIVKPNTKPDEKFFDLAKQKAIHQNKNSTNVNEELPSIPFERKTFFK